jgi:hypothetical protein
MRDGVYHLSRGGNYRAGKDRNSNQTSHFNFSCQHESEPQYCDVGVPSVFVTPPPRATPI